MCLSILNTRYARVEKYVEKVSKMSKNLRKVNFPLKNLTSCHSAKQPVLIDHLFISNLFRVT